jgi:hypothetical protein
MFKYVVGFLSLGMFTSAVFAQPVIDVGTHQLQPNTAGQTIQLFVSGGDAVEAINFSAQVDGGGSAGGGNDTGPTFTNLDLLTGTIFAPNNSGQFGGPGFPQLAIGSTITDSGSVAANGLLATLTVDTTGVSSGDYAFLLSDTLNGNTDFGNIHPTITNGTIHVTPEPASMALLGLGSLVVLRIRRRRQS